MRRISTKCENRFRKMKHAKWHLTQEKWTCDVLFYVIHAFFCYLFQNSVFFSIYGRNQGDNFLSDLYDFFLFLFNSAFTILFDSVSVFISIFIEFFFLFHLQFLKKYNQKCYFLFYTYLHDAHINLVYICFNVDDFFFWTKKMWKW